VNLLCRAKVELANEKNVEMGMLEPVVGNEEGSLVADERL